ncbi:hypothetical protein SASPL_133487 [Salvia splendens]|uniref:Uncharacterized protein n=1 Tax=Salvia splendens TaxID=180675 RepID=A0A8X8X351_SALSN|nr:hypothetical protein SASPL_133487 [Salvia splendens]
MVNQESLKKLCKENREKVVTHLMYHCLTRKGGLHGLGLPDLNDVAWMLDYNLKEIYRGSRQLEESRRHTTPEERTQRQHMGDDDSGGDGEAVMAPDFGSLGRWLLEQGEQRDIRILRLKEEVVDVLMAGTGVLCFEDFCFELESVV